MEITADVKDFEMGEISINGTSLNLNINLDTEELTGKLLEIKEAAEDLDDGAGKLDNGTKQLKNGADGLDDGAKELKKGVDTLNDGIRDVKKALGKLAQKSGDLTDGSTAVLKNLQKIKKSLDKVNTDAGNLEKLSAASSQIKTGITSLVTGLQTVDNSIGNYYQALSQAGLSDVNSFISQHNQAIAALGITDTGRVLYQAYTDNGNAGVLQKEETAVPLYRIIYQAVIYDHKKGITKNASTPTRWELGMQCPFTCVYTCVFFIIHLHQVLVCLFIG